MNGGLICIVYPLGYFGAYPSNGHEELKRKKINCVIKTNLMHYLSSVYFVNQPLHVSGIFVAHHQEEKHNTYQLLYIYSIPPDDGLQTCPKHVEVY